MGDGLKLSKDKRHRSSSSLAGSMIDGTRSERKLDIRASIPEVDDQLVIAEARCEDLEKKIDLVKLLKRKKKLKKRSMTRVVERPATPENVPVITVRTQPKKKVSQQAARLRRLEMLPNPTRGYLDPATVEQHNMIGQVQGYNQHFIEPRSQVEYNTKTVSPAPKCNSRMRQRRRHAEGDTTIGQGVQIHSNGPMEVACGDDEFIDEYIDFDACEKRPDEFVYLKTNFPQNDTKQVQNRRKHVLRKEKKDEQYFNENTTEVGEGKWRGVPEIPRRKQTPKTTKQHTLPTRNQEEDRPVVELFNKNRSFSQVDSNQLSPQPTPDKRNTRSPVYNKTHRYENNVLQHLDEEKPIEIKKEPRQPRRVVKYRTRRYELPTVASQMKQAGVKHCYEHANHTNIPFIVSKSTTPSHNIGVNLQQVLNGLKIQQPLSGIPLTIAHHMGLGHVPYFGTKSVTVQPSLENHEINAIKVGDKLLRLPSAKYISYSRMLSMYRQGDGMVPRFLRSISRPHYFYTSMYNLATNREDFDGATSKGGRNNEAKQSLAEYANIHRQYEQIEKSIQQGNYTPDLERRKDELSKELAAREEQIRKVVQDYRGTGEGFSPSTLRASASTAEDDYRHSTFKLNVENRQH